MTQTIVEPAEITVFLERMLDEGGMKDLAADVRKQMLEDLSQRLQHAMFAAIVMKLPKQVLPQLESLIEKKTPATKVQAFLKKHIPKIEEVLASEMLSFRNRYIKEQ